MSAPPAPPDQNGHSLGARRNLVLLIALAFAISVYLTLLIAAKFEFGLDRILGWDTLVYAISAQETLKSGMGWMIQEWRHPNSYVLLLSTVQWAVQDITSLSNALPIALVGAVVIVSGVLGNKLGGQETFLLAALLTATSFATFRLFVDLHRALLAFVLVTLLIAIDAPSRLGRMRLQKEGVAVVILAIVMAFSEFEIYLAFFLASLVRVAFFRGSGRETLLSVLWLAVPGILFAATPAGWALLASVQVTPAVVVTSEIPVELTMLYLSTIVTIPFAIVGFFGLIRSLRSDRSGPAVYLLAWVSVLLLLMLILGVVLARFSPFRALLLLHVPILGAFGLHILIRTVFVWIRKSGDRMPGIRLLRMGTEYRPRLMVFSAFAVSLVLFTGIQLGQNSAIFLRPILDEDLRDRLVESSQHIAEKGWPAPIYLVMNRSHAQILPPIRFELGLLNGPTYLYWGPLNFVAFDVPPHLVDPGIMDSREVFLTIDQEYRKIRNTLGRLPEDILSHPIVVLRTDLFPRTLLSRFEAFHVGGDIYVIPPNALTVETFNVWELRPVEDSYGLGEAYPVERNWSLNPPVVEIYTTRGYEISFPYYFPIEGTYTISLHLFDFPQNDFDTTIPLSHLELVLGDEVVNTLVYGRQQVVWWNTTIEARAGFDIISLRASNNTAPFRLSLDTIVIAAVPP